MKTDESQKKIVVVTDGKISKYFLLLHNCIVYIYYTSSLNLLF